MCACVRVCAADPHARVNARVSPRPALSRAGFAGCEGGPSGEIPREGPIARETGGHWPGRTNEWNPGEQRRGARGSAIGRVRAAGRGHWPHLRLQRVSFPFRSVLTHPLPERFIAVRREPTRPRAAGSLGGRAIEMEGTDRSGAAGRALLRARATRALFVRKLDRVQVGSGIQPSSARTP